VVYTDCLILVGTIEIEIGIAIGIETS